MSSYWNFATNENQRVTKKREPFRIVKEEKPPPAQDTFVEIKPKSGKRRRVTVNNDVYDQLMMMCVPVKFPRGLNLYQTQRLMIVRVITALKNSQNVLAESPTGSGKTMALLASTCGWLSKYNEDRKESREKCVVHGFGKLKEEEWEKEDVKIEVKEEDVKVEVKKETEEKQKKDDVEIIVLDDDDDDNIPEVKPRVKKETLYDEQFENDFIPYNEADSKRTAKLEEEVPEEKTEEKPKEPDCTCLPRARIYYGTRTHKQIAQVVKEFSRLPYANVIKHTILASREQSCIHPTARKQPDISQYCKEVNSAHGIGCSFKTAMKNRYEKAAPLRDHLMNMGTMVFDIEEIVETLATTGPQLCPYFCTNRVLTQDADLIFCPFSYLVDPVIRNSSDVHMKNSIIVLDEAHNIEDTCREAASFTFTEKELDDSVLTLRLKRVAIDTKLASPEEEAIFSGTAIRNDILKEFRANLLLLEHLVLEILRWCRKISESAKEPERNDYLGRKSCTLSSKHLFESLTNVEDGVDLYNPAKTTKYEAIMNALNAVCKHNEPELQYFDQFKPNAVAIVCVEKWLYFQTYFGNEQYKSTYRLHVSIEPVNSYGRSNRTFDGDVTMNTSVANRTSAGPRNMQYKEENPWAEDGDESNGWLDPSTSQTGHQPISEGCKTTISMWCMSPAISFHDAFNETRSIVLASGTLCPMDTLKTELGMEFKLQVEGDQVIEKENIFAAVLPCGPYGNRIVCNYTNTKDTNSVFYAEVGAIIKYVCVNVPAGILCFLPSYRVLEALRDSMQRSQSLQAIKAKKVVLFEPRRSSELSGVMSEFDTAILNPKKYGATINGALMFAVFRGKVSEGIDFADDRARVVISVGIPYPNAMDDQVKAKKLYNDQNAKQLGILTGDEWYTTQAYRALNQALGRCLRHKNDWGAMLMIDDRLERQVGKMTTGTASARVSKWIRAELKSYPSFKMFNDNFRTFIEGRHALQKQKQEEATA